MERIKEGIVFSNDIYRILCGYNALDFDYSDKNIVIPRKKFIKTLREDFKKDVERIFPKVTIISEGDMLLYINQSISDVYRRYPHRIFG
ncbi:MAG: hypothetical protein IKH54_06640 [Bacilli bacterium]|nr:hypothetical protein [Bacilli bacterium]